MVDIAVSETALDFVKAQSGFWHFYQDKKRKAAQSNYLEMIALEAQDTAHDRRKKDLVAPNSSIVFRLDATVDWQHYLFELEKLKEYLKENADRNEYNNQYLIYSKSHEIEICNILVNSEIFINTGDILSRIRNNELSNFVQSTYSMFEHGGHAYFELPSKGFSDYFFRVGNVQTENMFSNAIFFWINPYLKRVNSIFADTWSISTTAAKISKYLTKYRGNRDSVPWEFSSNYLPYAEIGKAKYKKALSELDDGYEMLFLASFTSSGRLYSEVQRLSREIGRERQSKYISIFVSSEQEFDFGQYLCDIRDNLDKRKLSGRCVGLPPSDKPIFEVHSRTYFPDYRKINVTKFRVKYARYKEFFERYAAKGIMSVYKTGSTAPYPNKDGFSTKNRHHSFHISAAKLFSDSTFKKRFGSVLESSPVNDSKEFAFLRNDTESSNQLCELFKQFKKENPVSTFVSDSANFLGIEHDPLLRKFLGDPQNTGKTLVVSVPMVVGGGSLGNIQRELRSIVAGENKIKPNIIILIGVMRPSSEMKARELSNLYLERDANETSGWATALVVETVVLPNWQEQKCPWNRELSTIISTLQNPNVDGNVRIELLRRKELLETASNEGLQSNDVFFTQSKDRLIFNPNSRFLDLDEVGKKIDLITGTEEDDFGFLGKKTLDEQVSESDLCCAVASALQVWREEAQASPLHFSTIDAASIDNLNGYNESRLRAAIWRALTPKELSSVTRADGNTFEILARLIFDKNSDDKNYTDLNLEALLSFQMDLPRALGVDVEDWEWDDFKFLSNGTQV